MGRSVSRSSAVARSIRRVSRYRCGGTPKASLNDRAKWAAETLLTRASRRTDQASCEAASIRSFARSRRRKSSGSWLAGPSLIPPPKKKTELFLLARSHRRDLQSKHFELRGRTHCHLAMEGQSRMNRAADSVRKKALNSTRI